MPVAIEIQPQGGIDETLARIAAHLDDLTPVTRLMGEIVHGSIQENFEAGGRPTAWAPLSAATIAQRLRQGKWPGRTLMRLGVAGGLFGSISYRPFKDRVELSANKAYAALHQFGARKGQFGTVTAQIREHVRLLKSGKEVRVRAHTRTMTLPWGNIPARPYMMVQDEDWDEIRDSIADLLLGGAR